MNMLVSQNKSIGEALAFSLTMPPFGRITSIRFNGYNLSPSYKAPLLAIAPQR
jgi:hypothetical protein